MQANHSTAEEQILMDPSLNSESSVMSEKKRGQAAQSSRGSMKLVVIHVMHLLLVAVHAVALVAAIKNWVIRPGLVDITLLQTGITASLQAAFTVIIGVLVSLAREIAVDADIRAPPTLGILHLRLQAWSGLASSLTANLHYSRSHSTPSTPESSGLKHIFLYLGFCTLLQISSGSIFAITLDVNASETLVDYLDPVVLEGGRFGDFDSMWPSDINLTSTDTTLFPPASLNAAVNMFAGRTNDTRYPGLQARLIHDTVNLDSSVAAILPWNEARVNASLVNVHCSQVSNATVNTFSLPFRSTNMSLAVPSPTQGNATVLFPDTSRDRGVWINVSVPAPPYMSVPELNISGYWGSNEEFEGLPTTVFFQPWKFDAVFDRPQVIGHNQVVMVIATQYYGALLTDSTNSTGHTWSFQAYPESGTTPLSQAYVQIIGCSVRNDNLTATIDNQSRLLDPLTDVTRLIGPEAPHDDHPWDEFDWVSSANNASVSPPERQFLFAFTPSTPAYNDTSDSRKPIAYPETVLATLLEGNLFSPFRYNPSQPNSLVNFQGSLERLFASYLWNINRLCSPFDDIQPYWESCGTYSDTNLFSSAEFVFVFPVTPSLIVVRWRAILSLVCCVLMWLTLGAINASDGPRRTGGRGMQQAQELMDFARLFSRGSRIPQVVAAEALSLTPQADSDRALLDSTMKKRLRYVEEDDGLGGYLDIVDDGQEM